MKSRIVFYAILAAGLITTTAVAFQIKRMSDSQALASRTTYDDPVLEAAHRFFTKIGEPVAEGTLERGPKQDSRNVVAVFTSKGNDTFSEIYVNLDTLAVIMSRPGNPIAQGYDPSKPNVIKTKQDLVLRAAELHAWNNEGEAEWGIVGEAKMDTHAAPKEEVKIENGLIRGPVKVGPRGKLQVVGQFETGRATG